jgi:hypothetical protein
MFMGEIGHHNVRFVMHDIQGVTIELRILIAVRRTLMPSLRK